MSSSPSSFRSEQFGLERGLDGGAKSVSSGRLADGKIMKRLTVPRANAISGRLTKRLILSVSETLTTRDSLTPQVRRAKIRRAAMKTIAKTRQMTSKATTKIATKLTTPRLRRLSPRGENATKPRLVAFAASLRLHDVLSLLSLSSRRASHAYVTPRSDTIGCSSRSRT